MKDIAEAADVSIAAVSRILRSQKLEEFSPETQKRVHDVAQQLGWRPNLLVQGLQTGKTGTLGVFVAPFDTYWTGVLYGIHDVLLAANRVPIVLWPHALVHPMLNLDPEDRPGLGKTAASIGHSPVPDSVTHEPGRGENNRLLRLIDRRVDAIITWPLFEADAIQSVTASCHRGWPVVTLDFELPDDAPATMVAVDENRAMQLIFEHLNQLKLNHTAYLGLDRDQTWVQRRRASFERQTAAAGNPARPKWIWRVETASATDRPHIVDRLRRHPEVTAVVAASDHLALQVIEAAHELGRRVPHDLSVVGYGNMVFDTTAMPLTTIEQNPYEIGATAARLALGPPTKAPRVQTIEPRLVVRHSTSASMV
ncbi:MAG: LacI family DNA-binding transcriptional regulator [Planctomycetota bacterium]